MGLLALVALAVGVRLSLVALGWPATDSDESTMGLMALHIAYRGEHPLVFYGAGYLGALEAYLGALGFLLFGPSLLALRLGQIALFSGFLVATYVLARRLYDTRVALVSVALLSLGSSTLLFREVGAVGGAMETLFFGSSLFALTAVLVQAPTERRTARRVALYALWGVVAGLGIWSHLLIVPYVLAAGAWLLWVRRAALWPVPLFALLLGGLLGLAPLIAHNLSAAPDQTTLRAALISQQSAHVSTLPQRLVGTVTAALPAATGASVLCPNPMDEVWPLDWQAGTRALACAGVRGAWSVGFLALWLVATWRALRGLRWARRVPGAEREAASQAGRLALLLGAGASLAAFTVGNAAGTTPWTSSRYLVGLLLAVPALLAPLAEPMALAPPARPRPGRWYYVAPVVLVGLLVVFALGTLNTYTLIPEAQATARADATLLAALRQRNVTRLYADYWTCGKLMFLSRDQVACASLNDTLGPGTQRYVAARALVQADPAAAYVFPVGSPQAAAVRARGERLAGQRYTCTVEQRYLICTVR